MKFVQICLFVQFLALINGKTFENILQYIENELEKLQIDTNLGAVEKYLKMVVLKNTLDQIIESREHELRKIQDQETQQKLKEEKELEERTKLESKIFQKYLAKNMGGTSFARDFHTMRY